MKILDQDEQWHQAFREGWLAHFQQTGDIDWNLYVRPQNHTLVTGPGVDLISSRLMLISSAGAYLPETQQPFDASNPLGDYSIRVLPSDISFSKLAYAHEHYDNAAVLADPQVLLPLAYLREMVSEGQVGALTAMVSFMGYQPDISQVLDETIPTIINFAEDEVVDAALLVPA
jgi:hypothetical protein